MRTPGILIFGMVLAPCGWILNLTSTVAPNWRTIHNLANEPTDLVVEQGIWDICRTSTTSRSQQCNQQSNDQTYFSNQIIPIAKGMMVASLIVTVLGLAVATPGVRCWKDRPRWILASLGGLLIFCSGALTIIPIAWCTHLLTSLNSTSVKRDPARADDIRVGYCIILGYIGGILELLGGFVILISTACSAARGSCLNCQVTCESCEQCHEACCFKNQDCCSKYLPFSLKLHIVNIIVFVPVFPRSSAKE
uniref:Claudin-23-like n=1 Tax=Sinocyclocheilus rhinocerous TaxID=307959 RepID=A0A673HH15_9TELE